MRLINTETLQLEVFRGDDVPLYAILSHTWEDDEVDFEDMATGSKPEEKQGYRKIRYACKQAHENQLSYLWVDTCCIDKRSSAELQEAINSMFRYYSHASACFVYLADVSENCPLLEDYNLLEYDDSSPWRAWHRSFRKSRWFTRGWTLQELLAPQEVKFYGSKWNFIGKKQTLIQTISRATQIDASILTHTTSIFSVSVARRMSWAAHRQTSRAEDKAYCLLGIFNVNMPMLYGEGSKAFIRLQEEILKTSTDHSIFAWEFDKQSEADGSLLAASPSNFAHCHNIVQWGKPRAFQMMNRGLQIALPTLHCITEYPEYLAILNCRYANDLSGTLALRLRKYGGGEEYHAMKGRAPLQPGLAPRAKVRPRSRLSFVCEHDMVDLNLATLQITREYEQEASKIKFWIPLADPNEPKFHVIEAYPEQNWDLSDGIMHAGDDRVVRAGVVIRTSSDDTYAVAFGFDLVNTYDPAEQGEHLIPGIWGWRQSRSQTLQDLVGHSLSKCQHALDSCRHGRCTYMPTYLTLYEFPKPNKLEAQIYKATIMTETVFIVTLRINDVFELETFESVAQLDVVGSRTVENQVMKTQLSETQTVPRLVKMDLAWSTLFASNAARGAHLLPDTTAPDIGHGPVQTVKEAVSPGKEASNSGSLQLRANSRVSEGPGPVQIWMNLPDTLRLIARHPSAQTSAVVELPSGVLSWDFTESESIRGGVILASYGGSEILIAFTETNDDDVDVVAQERPLLMTLSEASAALHWTVTGKLDLESSFWPGDFAGNESDISVWRLGKSVSMFLPLEKATVRVILRGAEIPEKQAWIIDISYTTELISTDTFGGAERPNQATEPQEGENGVTGPKLAMGAYFSGDLQWNISDRDSAFRQTNVLNDLN